MAAVPEELYEAQEEEAVQRRPLGDMNDDGLPTVKKKSLKHKVSFRNLRVGTRSLSMGPAEAPQQKRTARKRRSLSSKPNAAARAFELARAAEIQAATWKAMQEPPEKPPRRHAVAVEHRLMTAKEIEEKICELIECGAAQSDVDRLIRLMESLEDCC